jgi:hypothetical protein
LAEQAIVIMELGESVLCENKMKESADESFAFFSPRSWSQLSLIIIIVIKA